MGTAYSFFGGSGGTIAKRRLDLRAGVGGSMLLEDISLNRRRLLEDCCDC